MLFSPTRINMAGSLCPHVQSDVTKYKNQLPDEYLPAISTAIKARINISQWNKKKSLLII